MCRKKLVTTDTCLDRERRCGRYERRSLSVWRYPLSPPRASITVSPPKVRFPPRPRHSSAPCWMTGEGQFYAFDDRRRIGRSAYQSGHLLVQLSFESPGIVLNERRPPVPWQAAGKAPAGRRGARSATGERSATRCCCASRRGPDWSAGSLFPMNYPAAIGLPSFEFPGI